MDIELHTHNYIGKTSFNIEHSHNYMGITSSNPNQEGHIHYVEGITTLSDGHIHNYKLQTSPAINVKGGHYHYYNGTSSIAFVPSTHTHSLVGYTSIYTG